MLLIQVTYFHLRRSYRHVILFCHSKKVKLKLIYILFIFQSILYKLAWRFYCTILIFRFKVHTESNNNLWFTFCFRVDSKKKEDIECEPCLNDAQKITATHFCKTCEDPEPLCESCAKQHSRQKAFRDHELSRNIREFKNHASNKRYCGYTGRLKCLSDWLFW